MKHISLIFALLITNLLGAQKVTRIAFGSCGNQDHPLPIFDVVMNHKPDVFVFLGDNIYGDTHNMDTLKAKYARLGQNAGFQRLKATVPLLATWDDHDYGWNDSGRHYPEKLASKQIFMQFWGIQTKSDVGAHEGIYRTHFILNKGRKVQIILLDTRTFRDDLQPYKGEFAQDKRYFYELDYAPYTHTDSTLLGAAQWRWLEQELRKPADVRIIASSTQFGIEFNGYEAWANFPHEQKRMLDLIKTTGANGVVFLSGDVHYAELSRMQVPGLYPIYDCTSSGLSSTWHFATPNRNRIEGPIMDNHFGLLTIKWGKRPTLLFEIWDVTDNQRLSYEVELGDLMRG